MHPLDVRTLMSVFRHLIDNSATVIVIEHDLEVSDRPIILWIWAWKAAFREGGWSASGTPEGIAANEDSITGKYL